MCESSIDESIKRISELRTEYNEVDVEEGRGAAMIAAEYLDSLLREAGLLAKKPKIEHRYPPISQARREELAQIFSVGKPLSQIIIDDRG